MHTHPSERGQAIIFIAIAFIVLLGFAGLAIDAGTVYSDRRQAQNVADAAALAAAAKASLSLENGGTNTSNWSCASGAYAGLVTTAKNAAINRAATNSVTLLNNLSTGNGVEVTCVNDSAQADPQHLDVTVQISTTTKASFSQFLFGGPLRSQVEAITRVHPRTSAFAGFAIVALNNCSTSGGSDIAISGGGNSGGVDTFQGGIFLNTTGSSCCALDPGSSANAGFIQAHDGYHINSVGTCSYSGNDKILPNPVLTGYNGGQPVADPLASLPEPTCSANGTKNADGTFNPGNWNGGSLGPGSLKPGLYCISGSMGFSGKQTLQGTGVTLYFKNGGLTFTGQSGMSLTAPTAANCTSESCPYTGIVIFSARSNTNTLEVRGNGSLILAGTVYAIKGTMMARGGGSSSDETTIQGQVIASNVDNRGNGSLVVTYDQALTFQKPTSLDLFK